MGSNLEAVLDIWFVMDMSDLNQQINMQKETNEYELPYTVVFRYYDTAGIRKKYHNIQTIELSSINF